MGHFNKFSKGRDDRGGFGGGRKFGDRGDAPRQMFAAVCSQCGKNCEIPFKPSGGRPVFCHDCFKNQGGAPSFGQRSAPAHFGGGRPERAPINLGSNAGQNMGGGNSGGISKSQFEALAAKVDKILAILGGATPKESAKESKPEVTEEKTKKVIAKKAKAPAKKAAKAKKK